MPDKTGTYNITNAALAVDYVLRQRIPRKSAAVLLVWMALTGEDDPSVAQRAVQELAAAPHTEPDVVAFTAPI